MTEEELRAYKNKALTKDISSITNRLNHAFNQGYELGRKDTLDKIRAEINQLPYQRIFGHVSSYSLLDVVIEIIDRCAKDGE